MLDSLAVKKHAFYTVAILLAVVALILNLMGRDHFMQASRHRAERVAAAQERHAKYLFDSESISLMRSGRVLTTVGVTLTAFGLGAMIVSLIRRERGWYLILTGLLLSDVVAVLLL
jgi:hypothetical protein